MGLKLVHPRKIQSKCSLKMAFFKGNYKNSENYELIMYKILECKINTTQN